jgi:hypothetical protein
VQLGHVGKADGRWRLYAFAGAADHARMRRAWCALCKFLEESPDSPVRKYTPAGQDIDAVFDLRGRSSSSGTTTLAIEPCRPAAAPQGPPGLRDYEKVSRPT